MNTELFQLKSSEAIAPDINLAASGMVMLEGTQLTIAFLLSGDLEKVAIAPSKSKAGIGAARGDRLWEQTCFEFFLAAGPKPTTNTPYWEFNLSPSGDWNIFALDGYRRGLKEEDAISYLSFGVENKPESVCLDLRDVDISRLVSLNQPLWLGVSAVIVLKTGVQTFWAIAHPRPEPDFHHPDSFVLAL